MTYGIRITDSIGNVISVNLPDILNEIRDGNEFYWSILEIDYIGYRGENEPFPISEREIAKSDRGFFLSWEDLNTLARNFRQIIDLTLLGCLDKDRIKAYATDEEMYEACDIVIVMFDSSCWEVFTKDKSLIERWANKFKEVEWLVKSKS